MTRSEQKTFHVLLRQLVVPAGEKESRLSLHAARRLALDPADIISCQPVRRSLDARKRRGKAVAVYHVRLELPNRLRKPMRTARHPDLVFERKEPILSSALADPAPPPGQLRPLVVGAGPAGLFAALRLARAGWRPLLIDRGDDVAARRRAVADFWRHGVLDPESNVLYGAGGAGLFSDGKLNTRHKDRDGLRAVLQVLVEHGAPESILVDADPHVGSDRLGDVVAGIADEIRRWGGEIRQRCRLDRLHADKGVVTGATLAANGETTTEEVRHCFLATGHSARDVYAMLGRVGLQLAAKPFALGVRVELPQRAIDASQRSGASAPANGEAASFRLTRAPTAVAAACYTFCMCPGGQVIACASEPGRLAVNGMSNHARAGEWGNAAFLAPVTPEDIAAHAGPDVPPALAGIALQRCWEEKAWRAGGGGYAVPAMRLADFVAGKTGELPERRGVDRAVAADLRDLLPERQARTLAEAVPAMLARLRAVRLEEVVLYGVETRTSSPVRILRGKNALADGFRGVYPVGEGSGYAGGIMTSALDGWTAAGVMMKGEI